MNEDIFNIPDDAPVDEVALREIEHDLEIMMKEFGANNLEQSKVLQAAAIEGGVHSVMDALQNMLQLSKIGIRDLAGRIGIKRVKLQKMFDGRIEMPPDVFSQISDLCKKTRPDIFENASKVIADDR